MSSGGNCLNIVEIDTSPEDDKNY